MINNPPFKLKENQQGSVLILFGVFLFAIVAVLALSIDLGKVQSGYSKISASTDASALSLAELVMKLKTDRMDTDENWRDYVPDEEVLNTYAQQIFKANFELDQSATQVEDYADKMNFDVTYSKKGDKLYIVSVEACANTNPTAFTKAVGGENQQRVCSQSRAEFAFNEVRNTETAFIIDKSAAYTPATLVAHGGSGVDTTRFIFVQQAINDILDKYYQEPEDNNYAAFTGYMYPYYKQMSRDHNLSGFDDTYLHIRGYDHMVYQSNGMHYGYPPGIRPISKEELHDKLRITFPIFKNAAELAAFDDRPPSEWPGGGLPNYWDRYLEVKDGYYNNDPILTNYYNNVNPNLPAFSGNIAGKPYKPLSGLQLNNPGTCWYDTLGTNNQVQVGNTQYLPCPQIFQPDGSKYPAGLPGNIQYLQEAWGNWFAYPTLTDLDDTSHPVTYSHVQPLTKNFSVLKDTVSKWTNLMHYYNQNISTSQKILNPPGKQRPAEFSKGGGAAGSNWLPTFMQAWLLVSEKWQGLYNEQSIHEKRVGANEDRSAIPKNSNSVTKHIIYLGSGIDAEGMQSACYNGFMPEMEGGPIIMNACFNDFYMPTTNMTDDQFISTCTKIKDSGVKIHIVLQGFNPSGDIHQLGVGSIGGTARKYSSSSLVKANGQPNDRRYRQCASLKTGSDTARSFYLNPASADVPRILEQIYQDEITSTATVRLSRIEK